ncbi:MAG: hypothetical protein ABID45_03675 [Patescibacteria group bacterium]
MKKAIFLLSFILIITGCGHDILTSNTDGIKTNANNNIKEKENNFI